MKYSMRSIIAIILCLCLLGSELTICANATDSDNTESPLLQVENIAVTEEAPYDLTTNTAASSVMTLSEGTIIVHYQSTGTGAYQSLFSVSNNTADNPDRHFHLYITPDGTLGMELRNTDSVFKYTLSAANAVDAGTENIVALSANGTSGVYKLFANGEVVATLTKDEFVFFDDITGVNAVTLGATDRSGNTYPFAGTIFNVKVYSTPLTDDEVIAETSITNPEPEPTEPTIVPDPDPEPDPTSTLVLQKQNVIIEAGTPCDLTDDPSANAVLSLTEGTIVVDYESTGTGEYQSLFSVSNNTTGNSNRHFHVYITPGGTLGMELRNTDEVFKYTMSAADVLTSGSENIIAFSADSVSGTYKLFANGTLVSTLTKDVFVFFDDIDGLNTVTLGATVRDGNNYPFAGTVYNAEVHNVALSDTELIAATTLPNPSPDPDPVVVNLTRDNVDISSGTVADLSSDADAAGIFDMDEGTILIKYVSTGDNSVQSLFSVANSTSGNQNRHFHVYITPGGALGFELRNTDSEFKYTASRASAVRNTYMEEPAINTIAFRADSTNKTYTLFANGQKIKTLTENDYKFISDITGLDKISIGGTIRSGSVSYPFAGSIESIQITNSVYSDEELIEATSDTQYGTFIFSSEDGLNCNYYRIPSLLTLKSGKTVAAADARFGGTHDSKSNIDIAFSYSSNNGQSWSAPIMPLHFDDYADQKVEWPTATGLRDLQISGSASFIDPSMVQDSDSGRLYLFADVMPAGIGSSNASIGNGYKTIDGSVYLKLRWHEDSSSTYNYSVRENGVIYNDATNTATEYTVNDDFEVFKNGEPLTVKQYTVSIVDSTLNETKSNVDVAMNVFYKDSYFKVFPTTYLGMVYSDDEGATWSSMKLLNTMKSDSEKLLITGPGVGIQIKNGTYAGRLVLPVYSITLAGVGVIYSDDGGNNWTYAPADDSSSGSTAEAQIVEMPDGSLKMFVRTSSSYVAERTSIDGGVTWTAEEALSIIPTTSYGTQLSVINYSGTIDGKSAIILSSPNATGGRNTGKIRIGLINDTGVTGTDRYNIDWAYDFTIDGTVGYSYSCLSELANGEIGVLYEKYDSWSRDQLHLINVLPFESYTINELTGS